VELHFHQFRVGPSSFLESLSWLQLQSLLKTNDNTQRGKWESGTSLFLGGRGNQNCPRAPPNDHVGGGICLPARGGFLCRPRAEFHGFPRFRLAQLVRKIQEPGDDRPSSPRDSRSERRDLFAPKNLEQLRASPTT
jgi:hypothetical protein